MKTLRILGLAALSLCVMAQGAMACCDIGQLARACCAVQSSATLEVEKRAWGKGPRLAR